MKSGPPLGGRIVCDEPESGMTECCLRLVEVEDVVVRGGVSDAILCFTPGTELSPRKSYAEKLSRVCFSGGRCQ